jgi:rubrerythrin
MSKSEDLAARARLNREIVLELLEKAKQLRAKAQALARESDTLAAKAVDDIADYLEEAADQLKQVWRCENCGYEDQHPRKECPKCHAPMRLIVLVKP